MRLIEPPAVFARFSRLWSVSMWFFRIRRDDTTDHVNTEFFTGAVEGGELGAMARSVGHQTGYWTIARDKADDLVGKSVYLHKSQKGPSWEGGIVRSVRTEPYNGKDRVVFNYLPKEEKKGITAPKINWGYRAEKLITDDGIHLLHKDPEGVGSEGRLHSEPDGIESDRLFLNPNAI